MQQNDSILDVPASRFIWQGRLIKGGDYDDDDNKNDDDNGDYFTLDLL